MSQHPDYSAETLIEGWRSVSIEHRGPDGTEVLAMLVFMACPLCGAVVPPPDDEHDLVKVHIGYHQRTDPMLVEDGEGTD